MQPLLDWVGGLPPAALYLVLALAAAVENFFPPFPADTVVAFGSFVAARGRSSAVGTFLATWIGNVGGAMAVYWLGRRYGADRLMRRLSGGREAQAKARLDALYGRYGVVAIALSRFLPGIRAVVPPFAGAARVPAMTAFIAMAAASAVWYGSITVLAFQAGSRWDDLAARVGTLGRNAAIGAAVLALVGGVAWFVRRRRR